MNVAEAEDIEINPWEGAIDGAWDIGVTFQLVNHTTVRTKLGCGQNRSLVGSLDAFGYWQIEIGFPMWDD
jgi:hypothetical protein